MKSSLEETTMPFFRASGEHLPARDNIAPVQNLDAVRAVITEALQPAHFFLRSPDALEWQPKQVVETSWEIYRGRLLDAAHTRQRQEFEAWSIFWVGAEGRSAEPILSVKLDTSNRQVHVVRSIYCYAWEGYHGGDNVYLSRETRKWVCELVGTIELQEFATLEALRDELICLLFHAVIGCSRLPLTSVEAPLPAFSLGELAYIFRRNIPTRQEASVPMRSFRDLIEKGLRSDLTWLEKTKLLEAVLRSISSAEEKEAADVFLSRWYALGHDDVDFAALCRSLFNEVALSPYTDFVERALAVLERAMGGPDGEENYIDLLSYLLRQTARHLTAYDLITFHHRGANYPDALFLDSVLARYVSLISRRPGLFTPVVADDPPQQKRKRIRRRALRQGWLLRKFYEGLPVPDAPTSPGENNRILPAPHQRVPEDQILQPALRGKRLYTRPTQDFLLESESLGSLLQECGRDLRHAEELQELGTALFLDRPMGVFKAPGEPDRTLLLSYEAWSRTIAAQRLDLLVNDPALVPSTEDSEAYRAALGRLQVPGVPLKMSATTQRPGAVSLADALKVAKDFVLLRTTEQAMKAFLALVDFSANKRSVDLSDSNPANWLLIVTAAAVGEPSAGGLLVYDDQLRKRLELQIDASQGYRYRAGQEYPRPGIRLSSA